MILIATALCPPNRYKIKYFIQFYQFTENARYVFLEFAIIRSAMRWILVGFYQCDLYFEGFKMWWWVVVHDILCRFGLKFLIFPW